MKKRTCIVIGMVLIVLFSLGAVQQDPSQRPRIAVLSAFGAELEVLRSMTEIQKEYVINGHTFTVGKLAGNHVVLALTGVSMENAAMTTQLILDRFNITCVIYSGIAGGVNPGRHIGDVIVASKWALYQKQRFARLLPDGTWGIEDPPFPNFGMMFPQYVSVYRKGGEPDVRESKFWFEVDPAMLAVAQQVAPTVDLLQCTDEGVCLEHDPVIVVGGNGVSGPTFVDNAAYREYTWATFEADALDMETAATALVAYCNGTPYIAFRSLSDLAGGGPGENQIGTFFKLAADNSAAYVLAFLEAWGQR